MLLRYHEISPILPRSILASAHRDGAVKLTVTSIFMVMYYDDYTRKNQTIENAILLRKTAKAVQLIKQHVISKETHTCILGSYYPFNSFDDDCYYYNMP